MTSAVLPDSERDRIRRRALVSWLPVLGGAGTAFAFADLPVLSTLGGLVWLAGIGFQFYVGYLYIAARKSAS